MPRTTGAKAKDYDAKRADLLEKIGAHLRKSLPHKPGLRELAEAAGVTIPTLKHYFGTRDGVITAYFQYFGQQGAPYLAIVAQASEPFKASMKTVVSFVLAGLVHARVIEGHAAGLSEAVGSARLGPSYLVQLLEPTLKAVEQRLLGKRPLGTTAVAGCCGAPDRVKLTVLTHVDKDGKAHGCRDHFDGRAPAPLA